MLEGGWFSDLETARGFHAQPGDYPRPPSEGTGRPNCGEIRQLIKHLEINEGVLVLPLPARRRNVFNYV